MGTHVREQETLVSTAFPTIGRRALVGGGLAALAAPAVGHSAPDPILIAIAEHARLWEAFNAAYQREWHAMTASGLTSAEYLRAKEEMTVACRREGAALKDLLATVPATPAGLLAWLDHLGSPMGFGDDGPAEEEFPIILATVRAFAEAAYA